MAASQQVGVSDAWRVTVDVKQQGVGSEFRGVVQGGAAGVVDRVVRELEAVRSAGFEALTVTATPVEDGGTR